MTDFETHPAGTAARIAELEAALDSIETSHGLTSNGNLWRFWSKKGQEVAADNTKLRQNLEHWRQEVGKLHSQVATLTDQLTRANAATAAAYEVAAQIADDFVQMRQRQIETEKSKSALHVDVPQIMRWQAGKVQSKAIAAAIRALATPDRTAALDKLIAEAVKPLEDALDAVLAWHDKDKHTAGKMTFERSSVFAKARAASKKGGTV